MSGHVFTHKKVKTRKKRQCPLCYRYFEKGTTMLYQVGVWDGSFYRSHRCETCDEIIEIHYRVYREDEFQDGHVLECLEKGQTPEQYLEQLKTKKL